MNGNTMELDKLLHEMRESYALEDAKDLTGELDLEALQRELNKQENAEMPQESPMEEQLTMFDEAAAEETEEVEPAEVNTGSEEGDRVSAAAEEGVEDTQDYLPEEEEDNRENKKTPVAGLITKLKGKAKNSEEKKIPEYVGVLHDVTWLLIAICMLFAFAVRMVGVKGESMEPTLENGNRLVLLCNFLSDRYKQGDIVVIVSEKFDSNTPLVKRVIATEGQTVDIDFTTGTVTVNGEVLEEDYIKELTTRDLGGFEYPVKVPSGCVFVLGDNRNHSVDSRSEKVGFVDKEDIVGRVLFRIWPLKRIGK